VSTDLSSHNTTGRFSGCVPVSRSLGEPPERPQGGRRRSQPQTSSRRSEDARSRMQFTSRPNLSGGSAETWPGQVSGKRSVDRQVAGQAGIKAGKLRRQGRASRGDAPAEVREPSCGFARWGAGVERNTSLLAGADLFFPMQQSKSLEPVMHFPGIGYRSQPSIIGGTQVGANPRPNRQSAEC